MQHDDIKTTNSKTVNEHSVSSSLSGAPTFVSQSNSPKSTPSSSTSCPQPNGKHFEFYDASGKIPSPLNRNSDSSALKMEHQLHSCSGNEENETKVVSSDDARSETNNMTCLTKAKFATENLADLNNDFTNKCQISEMTGRISLQELSNNTCTKSAPSQFQSDPNKSAFVVPINSKANEEKPQDHCKSPLFGIHFNSTNSSNSVYSKDVVKQHQITSSSSSSGLKPAIAEATDNVNYVKQNNLCERQMDPLITTPMGSSISSSWANAEDINIDSFENHRVQAVPVTISTGRRSGHHSNDESILNGIPHTLLSDRFSSGLECFDGAGGNYSMPLNHHYVQGAPFRSGPTSNQTAFSTNQNLYSGRQTGFGCGSDFGTSWSNQNNNWATNNGNIGHPSQWGQQHHRPIFSGGGTGAGGNRGNLNQRNKIFGNVSPSSSSAYGPPGFTGCSGSSQQSFQRMPGWKSIAENCQKDKNEYLHDRILLGNSNGSLASMRSLQQYLPSERMRNFQMHNLLGPNDDPFSEHTHDHYDNSNLNGTSNMIFPGSSSSPHPDTDPLGLIGGQVGSCGERFSRKVFVGGLPPDIDEDEITNSFRRFGLLVVDWPHKAESKSYFPPKGYAFLLFQDESSVQALIECCIQDEDKLYLCVSSPTIKDKPVQIRPWRLSDADFVLDASLPLDPRKTVFVGGVPRPLKAFELAMIMDRLYGGVCYAGIDTDPELKYPKGAGRVAFSNQQSYIAAISARFVQLQHGEIDKRVEVKPYVLDDQLCDECQGGRCGGKFAPFFCANVTCLQYYCEQCWGSIHSRPGREFHKPLVKEGAERPRTVPFKWC